MEPLLKFMRHWGAPVAAVLFFALWCVGEAGRMGPWPGLNVWSGTVPLVLMTVAIAVSVWQPIVSLALTAVLLIGQFFYVIPAMYANHWAIYIGSFIALAFILWTAAKRTAVVAVSANAVFIVAMTFLMISWRYSHGVGWFYPLYGGDRMALQVHGWQLFSVLTLIAAGCAAVGLALKLYQERGSLFHARNIAQAGLKEAEIDLIVEQERTRIARDLHDVLAHSLAVIAAQADGTRYLSSDQPRAVLNALENIAGSARRALVDAQRVIEGVRDDGMVAPQPRLSDVGPLVDRMRQGSLAIRRSESGTPVELTAGQELAVFRIVQECLTNALKHGGRGTAVRLHFDWSGPGLALHAASALADAGAPGEAGGPERVGRGIPGMRERAHLAGGWLTAGPDGEQFRVTAFVPYGLHAEAGGTAAGGTEAGAAGAVENVEPSAEPLEAAPLEAAALEAAPLEAAEPEGARPEAAVRG
ncbi:sensor histidine kinase [Arthrobacter oryzae]|uniref:sensor histidine kinase n=1 Tax=Arthrobacter oryzae TaxID=409290 RepID=UPI0027831D4B|nr:histidine kinase [Arthrobacter oryzae]MDQ0079221.1 signal transduction histidine kinase [Arthrobacter oryzae]